MSRKQWTDEKLFYRLIHNKTQKTFWDNIEELRLRTTKRVYSKAYQLACSAIDKEKIIGIYILAQFGINPRFQQQKTINCYFNLLEKTQSPKVLQAILSSISHNNQALNKVQINKLSQYKNHSFSIVRFSLVMALSGINNKVAIDTLIELSEDKHPHIRNWATFGIGSQIHLNDKKIISALKKQLNDTDEQVRIEAKKQLRLPIRN